MSLTSPALVQSGHAAVRTRVRREPQIGGCVRVCVRGASVGGGCNGMPRHRAHGKSAVEARRTCLRKLVVRLQTARLICATRTTRLKLQHTVCACVPCPALPPRAVRAPPSYLRMMSAFWSWNSRKPSNTMSPCGHGSRGTTLGKSGGAECQAWQECRRTTPIQTRLRSFPRMWHNRLTPSKQKASSRPFPSILVTCAYSVQSGGEGWLAGS